MVIFRCFKKQNRNIFHLRIVNNTGRFVGKKLRWQHWQPSSVAISCTAISSEKCPKISRKCKLGNYRLVVSIYYFIINRLKASTCLCWLSQACKTSIVLIFDIIVNIVNLTFSSSVSVKKRFVEKLRWNKAEQFGRAGTSNFVRSFSDFQLFKYSLLPSLKRKWRV